ncbi:hypothetical protein Memar_2340 [Methanoculleus marisnigri JR1]|uniref:Uncharacterized protein n=1 Tax=Methanoculleus marisnigri (strain ATCC 35101 / DSM 1498 / JR1) TaxID=368407 RepID=A3CY13_METMJ|nr:hypothetical protein Memar_2340 [Methanoculleus marisnigri JR1]
MLRLLLEDASASSQAPAVPAVAPFGQSTTRTCGARAPLLTERRQFNTPRDEHYIEFPGDFTARSRRSGA